MPIDYFISPIEQALSFTTEERPMPTNEGCASNSVPWSDSIHPLAAPETQRISNYDLNKIPHEYSIGLVTDRSHDMFGYFVRVDEVRFDSEVLIACMLGIKTEDSRAAMILDSHINRSDRRGDYYIIRATLNSEQIHMIGARAIDDSVPLSFERADRLFDRGGRFHVGKIKIGTTGSIFVKDDIPHSIYHRLYNGYIISGFIGNNEELFNSFLPPHRARKICSVCGERIVSGSYNHCFLTDREENVTVICHNCALRASSCYYCNYMFIPENGSSRTFCPLCVRDRRNRCYSCGERLDSNEDIYTYNDGIYCYRCFERLEAIHSYDFRPKHPVFHGDGDIHFGIEIEMERMGFGSYSIRELAEKLVDVEDNIFYIKHDGSLNCGWEAVSHPFTLEYMKKNDIFMPIKAVQEYMTANEVSCGFHVHMSASAFSRVQIYKLLSLVYRHERFIKRIAGRSSSRYASFSIPERSIGRKAQRLMSDRSHDNKYTVVNTTNMDTIEFRLFRGTDDIDYMKGYVEFCHAMWAFTKVASIRQCNPKNFCEFVAAHNNTYLNVLSIIESTRRI